MVSFIKNAVVGLYAIYSLLSPSILESKTPLDLPPTEPKRLHVERVIKHSSNIEHLISKLTFKKDANSKNRVNENVLDNNSEHSNGLNHYNRFSNLKCSSDNTITSNNHKNNLGNKTKTINSLESKLKNSDSEMIKNLDSSLYLGYLWNQFSRYKKKGKATHIGIFYVDKNSDLRFFHSQSNGTKDIQHLDYIEKKTDKKGINRYMIVKKEFDKKGKLILEKQVDRYHLTGIVKEDIKPSNLVHFLTLMKDAEEKGYPAIREDRIKNGKKRPLNGHCAYISYFYPIKLYDEVIKEAFKNNGIKWKSDSGWALGSHVWKQYKIHERKHNFEFKDRKYGNKDPEKTFSDIHKNYAINQNIFKGTNIYKSLEKSKKWNKNPIVLAKNSVNMRFKF